MAKQCKGTTVTGTPCHNLVADGGTCGKCKGVTAQPGVPSTVPLPPPSDPFASIGLDSPPEAAAADPDKARDSATLAVTDYGVAAGPGVQSIRKERYEARVELSEALVALEGREGMTKQEQVAALRESSRQALAAALRLEAAAQHAEQRDLDSWKAKKQEHGSVALPSVSGDGFVTSPEEAQADFVGWAADKAGDKLAPSDDEYDTFLQDVNNDQGDDPS